ncbi:MAG: diacylglycerol kinase family protein [Bacilli bacterium]|nr:diacylglycerol kinase family protein [Bacilli bacterium]
MIYVLFNPLSNNSCGKQDAENWAKRLTTEVTFKSIIDLDIKALLKSAKESDEVVLCGGDGTLHCFFNIVYGVNCKCKLSYAKCGTGNDFYRDASKYEHEGRVDLKPYLKYLPLVKVNGLERRFHNNVSYGVDGETNAIGNEIRKKKPGVKINYAKIAIGLMLAKFKPKVAEVEVDGVKSTFKHVWMATTMFGPTVGGGMIAAPDQDRLNAKHECDLVVLSSAGRIRSLLRFPSFIKGKHRNKKFITHLKGKHIKVAFSTPCALHIDGEAVLNVRSYEVINE